MTPQASFRGAPTGANPESSRNVIVRIWNDRKLPARSRKRCGLPRTFIERIAAERPGSRPTLPLRLGKALGTSAQLWLNLQNRYDVEIARRQIGKKLDRIAPVITHKAA